MSQKLLVAGAVSVLMVSAAMVSSALAAPLGDALTAEVIKVRDAQIAGHAAAPAAQLAVETAVQGLLSQSGAGTSDALAAIVATRAALGCAEPPAPPEKSAPTCPAWTNAALGRVSAQIQGLTKLAPSAGGAGGPLTIPPPPAFGAGGGGGGAGYRPS